MNKDVIEIDLRGNTHVKLDPCRGCIKRGNCEGEKYAEPGEYCRSKETGYAK